MRAQNGIVIAAAAAVLAGGCSSAPKAASATRSEPAQAAPPLRLDGPHVYDYFPQAQVYYDPQRNLWFWRGAGYWSVGQHLPDTIDTGSTARVLHLDTDKPYRVHAQVAALFADEAGEQTVVVEPPDEH